MANGLLTRASRTSRTLLDQIESPGALAPADRARLASAGIDVIVHHYLSGEGKLIRLP